MMALRENLFFLKQFDKKFTAITQKINTGKLVKGFQLFER